jgi:hypothetical protein
MNLINHISMIRGEIDGKLPDPETVLSKSGVCMESVDTSGSRNHNGGQFHLAIPYHAASSGNPTDRGSRVGNRPHGRSTSILGSLSQAAVITHNPRPVILSVTGISHVRLFSDRFLWDGMAVFHTDHKGISCIIITL